MYVTEASRVLHVLGEYHDADRHDELGGITAYMKFPYI